VRHGVCDPNVVSPGRQQRGSSGPRVRRPSRRVDGTGDRRGGRPAGDRRATGGRPARREREGRRRSGDVTTAKKDGITLQAPSDSNFDIGDLTRHAHQGSDTRLCGKHGPITWKRWTREQHSLAHFRSYSFKVTRDVRKKTSPHYFFFLSDVV